MGQRSVTGAHRDPLRSPTPGMLRRGGLPRADKRGTALKCSLLFPPPPLRVLNKYPPAQGVPPCIPQPFVAKSLSGV